MSDLSPQQYQKQLPNSIAVLVLGIVSIVGCMAYGVIGLACGIVALVLAKKDRILYQGNPEAYNITSYNNLNAGRTCAIIGVSLSACMFLFIAAYFSFIFTFVFSQIPFFK